MNKKIIDAFNRFLIDNMHEYCYVETLEEGKEKYPQLFKRFSDYGCLNEECFGNNFFDNTVACHNKTKGFVDLPTYYVVLANSYNNKRGIILEIGIASKSGFYGSGIYSNPRVKQTYWRFVPIEGVDVNLTPWQEEIDIPNSLENLRLVKGNLPFMNYPVRDYDYNEVHCTEFAHDFREKGWVKDNTSIILSVDENLLNLYVKYHLEKLKKKYEKDGELLKNLIKVI